MTDRTISGIGRMPDGSLRMVGEKHDGRLVVGLPKRLVDIVDAESKAAGMSRSAWTESALLEYLLDHGYETTD